MKAINLLHILGMGVQFNEWGYDIIIKWYKFWKTVEEIKKSHCKKVQEKAKGLGVKIRNWTTEFSDMLSNRKAIHLGITLF